MLLLDTHALLWWLAGEAIASDAMRRISDPGTRVVVSAVSVWEMVIKRALGKVEAPAELADIVVEEGFAPLAITMKHAERAGALPPHHRDPFDRMLIAQAQHEGLTVVTRDRWFDAYDVSILRC